MNVLKTDATGMPQPATAGVQSDEYNQPIAMDRETRRLLVDGNGSAGQYVTNTSATTPAVGLYFRRIFAHTATVVATATSGSIAGTLTNVAIPAGATWSGVFTSFTLTSGTVTAYYN